MKRCAMYLVALIVALALATVNAQTPGVITQCSDPGVVALTFDDGPSGNTENLLNSLKAADVPATFFLLGVQIDQVGNSTSLLQRMYDDGHQLALHTQTHPDLDSLSTSQRRNEMNQVLARVQAAVDLRPNYMRPPFGSCSDSCVTDISAMDYQVVIWNLDSNDWRFRDNGTSPADARAGTRENILSVINTSDSEQDNFISLQHDTIDYSVSLVPEVINAIRNKGYTFATVADCLNNGVPPYADDDTGDTGDTGDGTADGDDEGDDGGDEDDEDEDDEDGEEDDEDDEDGKGKDGSGIYTFYDGIANNTYDNSGNPKPINPKVSQKNSSKSSPNNSTDGTATAASVNNGTESADKADDDDDADENGVAAIAPHVMIIILSAVLVTMFAL